MDQQQETSPTQPMREKSNYMVPIAIVVAGAIIAGAIFFSDKSAVPTPTTADTTAAAGPSADTLAKVTVKSDDHILGNPSAPVVVVEYSDLECPFCKVFHQTMQKIMDEYGTTGDVAWVYRQFPLAQLHPKAPAEAAASECVAKLGGNDAFWKFVNKVFAVTPSNNGLDASLIPGFAEEAGVDKDTFNACVASGETVDIVNKGYNDAVAAGGQGTPYSVVVVKGKGTVAISGAQPYEYVKSIIDQALKDAKS
jgi:protein-disulfide isomerase